ncbi:hypothetical protein BRD20_04485 [Halobacteriales archaeon SW_8_65_20]|nr:MAG: hypothetical protein BRD20_04485 [Halobacteriales archaeon SW_8_65_20]
MRFASGVKVKQLGCPWFKQFWDPRDEIGAVYICGINCTTEGAHTHPYLYTDEGEGRANFDEVVAVHSGGYERSERSNETATYQIGRVV